MMLGEVKGLSTFEEWMVINKTAKKRDLQLINYALMRLKKNHFGMELDSPLIQFKAQDFSRESRKVSCNYVGIKKSINKINQIIVESDISFIRSCSYNDLTKHCEFHFHNKVDYFLDGRRSRLVSYKRFQDSLYLRTDFALRLYNFISKWRYKEQTKFIPIEDLRYHLGVGEDSYKRFERFRSCILDQSMEEINLYTRNKMDYQLKTSGIGSKVQSIRFFTESKHL